ncbi:lon-related putative ATP-dependent protease [Desulfonispora thiosulfatigenes DSM 11270]|uniref:endopeptidase La n=1 Tax=Desulfonispora thiosulfatigenes DSM 11270 TaxID=656914 RepID=A0A1W1VLH1_DESTI|nr:AAA family ATPase [Desulfonispora thiosulfatigenes]SMB94212.1 lon-related putative ATP-dependent protease [Desulfonispora thiosulfatigenes DSM 11270]
MRILKEYLVSPDKLKKKVELVNLSFETTKELSSGETIIGQERAIKSMDFGLQIKKSGYNIFITGLTGTGKTSYAELSLGKFAKHEEIPNDICYVYNFTKPSLPLCIELEASKGKELKEDMKKFIEKLKEVIHTVFLAENYEEKKKEIIKDYKEKRNQIIEELRIYAKDKNFLLKSTTSGYITLPMIENKEITNDEFETLEETLKSEIEENSEKVQQKALEVLKEIEKIEKNSEVKLIKLKEKTGLSIVKYFICCLQTKYLTNKKLYNYFIELKEDILKNLDIFLPDEDDDEDEDDEDDKINSLKRKTEKELFLKRYQVNLLIDNSNLEGAPVIVELNPNFQNILGKLEYDNDKGSLTTNFMKIKPGALHKANGGYLVLQAKDVLTNPYVWESLKRTLKSNKIYIEDIKEQVGYVTIASLKPEPIDMNIKVILLGPPYIYSLLYDKDEDFRKLFKIKVAFDYEMSSNDKNTSKMVYFIAYHCNKDNLKHFNYEAVIKVIEYSNRLAGNQDKLTTRFNELLEIIYEADTYAKIDNSEYVLGEHVQKAIEEKKYRHNLYEEKVYEQIGSGKVLISVEGYKVGEINALSVVDIGDYTVGKPNRITATTYMGKEGVINIERETNLSGNIHDKGLLILKGYLGEQFAQNYALTLSAKICFEQLYGGIDGDSASSTELYVLLSSLSDCAINQGIAVTGSINQKGEIQPVGGITEKIEGFYDICKIKGFTGSQGVLIPKKNISDLVLKDEIIEAVKEGKFSIYAIDDIKQGIEILTGQTAGTKDSTGRYPEGTLYHKIELRLEKYRKELNCTNIKQ